MPKASSTARSPPSASRARRSSRSSISPRSSAGSRPTRVREDKPIAIKGWKPENYSREYYGPVTLTQALALSLNTVSVRLTLEVGAGRGRQDRLPARHHVEARAQCLARARHLGGVAARARRRLRAVRQRRHRGRAARGRARAHARRQGCSTARAAELSAASIEPRYVGDDERDDAARRCVIGTAQQGAACRLAGRRQDRHQPGFPRRLVHRLHRAPRDRRVARQRQFLADQEGDRRRRCRSKSGAASCAPRIRAWRSRPCPGWRAMPRSPRRCRTPRRTPRARGKSVLKPAAKRCGRSPSTAASTAGFWIACSDAADLPPIELCVPGAAAFGSFLFCRSVQPSAQPYRMLPHGSAGLTG